MEVKEIIGGKYEIIKCLKEDESSEVAICINKYLKNKWVIKYIPNAYLSSSKELEHLIELDHNRIPKVVDKLQTTEGVYYIMECFTGLTLDNHIKHHNINIREVIEWLKTLAMILEHMHCRGITHGDLKPSNLIINQEGQISIIDLGSSFKGEDLKQYTLEYVAPERLIDHYPSSESSDLYSVGMLISFMLNHLKPSRRYLRLKKIMSKCLVIHPDLRLNQAITLYEALEKIS